MAWADTTLDKSIGNFRARFIRGGDANDLILQMRTWERHDAGATPAFGGDVERALKSIRVPLLYMPSETDRLLVDVELQAHRKRHDASYDRSDFAAPWA